MLDGAAMNKPYIPLPEAFVCRIHREFSQEASLLLEALDGPQSWGMRINPLRKDARILSERLSDKIDHVPWCSEGYYYDGERIHPGRHPYHNAGLYYLQDPSAMAVAEVLDVVPGQMVFRSVRCTRWKKLQPSHPNWRVRDCWLLMNMYAIALRFFPPI